MGSPGLEHPAIDFYRSLGAVPMSEWHVMRVSGERSTGSPVAALSA